MKRERKRSQRFSSAPTKVLVGEVNSPVRALVQWLESRLIIERGQRTAYYGTRTAGNELLRLRVLVGRADPWDRESCHSARDVADQRHAAHKFWGDDGAELELAR